MSHYTDAEVQAAAKALRGELNLNLVAASHIARIVLGAIEPAIAARALRDAADVLAGATPSATFAPGWMAAEMGLRSRAATAERGQL